jgi:hypothetical protein
VVFAGGNQPELLNEDLSREHQAITLPPSIPPEAA